MYNLITVVVRIRKRAKMACQHLTDSNSNLRLNATRASEHEK